MTDIPPEPPPSAEQVVEQRLIDCGLDANGVSVKYDDDLQGIEIVIGLNAGATTEHFVCIKQATEYDIVRFENLELWAAYREWSAELARPAALLSFEKRLKDIGKFDGFPIRADFESLQGYVEALEVHAGLEPGSALRVDGDHILFDPPENVLASDNSSEPYTELLAIISFATAKERLTFGFTGNETIAD